MDDAIGFELAELRGQDFFADAFTAVMVPCTEQP
jgi:hypothetical protein